MFDPFSLTGLVMIGKWIARRRTCPACKRLKLLSKWQSPACCQTSLCADCSANSKATRTCGHCGHRS